MNGELCHSFVHELRKGANCQCISLQGVVTGIERLEGEDAACASGTKNGCKALGKKVKAEE